MLVFWVVYPPVVAALIPIALGFSGPFSVGSVTSLYREVYTESWYLIAVLLASLAVIFVGQVLYLLPFRRPPYQGGPGRSMMTTLLLGAGGIAVMVTAAVLVIAELARRLFIDGRELFGEIGDYWVPFLLAAPVLLPAWAVATPIVIKFCRGGRREDRAHRLARVLFIGTVVEMMLVLPADVYVRRKDDCYCATGTYLAMIGLLFVGLIALGPVVLMPLIVRRHGRWYASHCSGCGYDMREMRHERRCPECGSDWKTGDPVSAAG